MRKKNWTLTPWFIIFAAAMLFMSIITYNYNQTLGYVEIGISVLVFVAVFAMSIRFGSYIRSIVKNATDNIKGVNPDYLEKFKFPIVVVGKKGDVVWCNSRFRKTVCNGKSPEGESVANYISGHDAQSLASGEGTDIAVNGREFTVYCVPSGQGVICHFFENTYYKQIAREHFASRPSVAVIVFDNAEDFSDNSDEAVSEVMLNVEVCLQKWAAQYNALYKRLGNNRYMIVFRDSDVEKMIGEKFPILREIRSITVERISATVSVGLSRGAKNIKESEANARKALEMALGRGGDQVAIIKKDNSYDFFGGKAAATEKASKVRMRVVSNAISRAIADSDIVYIMGHRFSDLDCVGAAIGMQCLIEKSLKRYCRIVINKELTMAQPLIDYAKNNLNSEIFISPQQAIENVTAKTLLVVVDTHLRRSLESAELFDKCKRVVVIDHHRKAVDYINNSLVFCHEPSASSACEMCSEIIGCLDDKPIGFVQADALLAGIMLDTKNFAVKTGVRTFEAAAYLRRKGANTLTVKEMFSDSIDTYREKVGIVCKAHIYRGCAVSVADFTSGDIRLASAQAADEMLNLHGVSASFVIFKDVNTENQINISSRSYGKINVQIIMEQMGGGGHQTMAATQIKDSTKELVYQQLLSVIDEVLDDASNN